MYNKKIDLYEQQVNHLVTAIRQNKHDFESKKQDLMLEVQQQQDTLKRAERANQSFFENCKQRKSKILEAEKYLR